MKPGTGSGRQRMYATPQPAAYEYPDEEDGGGLQRWCARLGICVVAVIAVAIVVGLVVLLLFATDVIKAGGDDDDDGSGSGSGSVNSTGGGLDGGIDEDLDDDDDCSLRSNRFSVYACANSFLQNMDDPEFRFNSIVFPFVKNLIRFKNRQQHKLPGPGANGPLYGPNQFSHFQHCDFRKRFLTDVGIVFLDTRADLYANVSYRPVDNATHVHPNTTLPASLNYCDPLDVAISSMPFTAPTGACVPVGDQQCCGSCYAWATAESAASIHWLLHPTNGGPTPLSVRMAIQATSPFVAGTSIVPLNQGGCIGSNQMATFQAVASVIGGYIPDALDPYGNCVSSITNCHCAVDPSRPDSVPDKCSAFSPPKYVTPAFSIPVAQANVIVQLNVSAGVAVRVTDLRVDPVTVINATGLISRVVAGGTIAAAENDMLQALWAHGPLSVGVYAGVFQHIGSVTSDNAVLSAIECFNAAEGGCYSGSNAAAAAFIATDFCSIDHVVLLVGYGTTAEGVPYWLVQNQWGTAWGQNGFIKIERGKNACGIATSVIRPLIS